MAKDYKLQVKMTSSMRERFADAAEKDGRSMSEVARALIADWIRKSGSLRVR